MYYTAAGVVAHLRKLHPDYDEDDFYSDVAMNVPIVEQYPTWRLVQASTGQFIPRPHDSDVAEDYAVNIESAPPIVAVPAGSKYRILDGAHRHAAAVLAGKRVHAFVPVLRRRR